MTVDYSRAWQIANILAPVKHNPKCSFRVHNGGTLCDCAVLTTHPEYKDEQKHHKNMFAYLFSIPGITSINPIVISNALNASEAEEVAFALAFREFAEIANGAQITDIELKDGDIVQALAPDFRGWGVGIAHEVGDEDLVVYTGTVAAFIEMFRLHFDDPTVNAVAFPGFLAML